MLRRAASHLLALLLGALLYHYVQQAGLQIQPVAVSSAQPPCLCTEWPAATAPPAAYVQVDSRLTTTREPPVTDPPSPDTADCPDEGTIPFGSTVFFMYCAICLGLVCLGGLMSGLTIGYFSLDEMKLRLLRMGGSAEDQARAAAVTPLVERHHWLLVTLLITNAGAMEALPIFLDSIMPTFAAILTSVSFVLFFGEVIPQAVCSQNPLVIGATLSPFVKVLMYVLSPVAYPIACLLDWILKDHGSHFLYKRAELKDLIAMHARERGGSLVYDEISIIGGVLSLREKRVGEFMTRVSMLYSLEAQTPLNDNTMADLIRTGHSRVPVYTGTINNVRGLVLVKRLITVDPSQGRTVGEFAMRKPLVVSESTILFDALHMFQEQKKHMAIVVAQPEQVELVLQAWRDAQPVPAEVNVTGIITLEDVMEELLQEKIIDETDIINSDVLVRAFSRAAHQKSLAVRVAHKFKTLVKRARERKASEGTTSTSRISLDAGAWESEGVRSGHYQLLDAQEVEDIRMHTPQSHDDERKQ